MKTPSSTRFSSVRESIFDLSNGYCPASRQMAPWEEEIERVKGMIKEREVSKFRAIFTFFQDFQLSQKTGRPVPLASVKGLINAWLFKPGAVAITAGSIIGTILLVFQVVIMWQQSKIMSDQVRLSQAQNNLGTIEQLSLIRSILANAESGGNQTSSNSTLGSVRKPPKKADIDLVVSLAGIQPTIVVKYLLNLLEDDNSTVSSGALLALWEINDETLHSPDGKFRLVIPDTYDVNLSNIDLTNRKLDGVYFKNCKFNDAILNSTSFIGSKFQGSSMINFTNTRLMNTFFNNATLVNIQFDDSKFNRTQMRGAKLEDIECERCEWISVDVDSATIKNSTFSNSTQKRTKGNFLEIIKVEMPKQL